MTVDCQWIDKNLEAFFCDKLPEEETRAAQEHIESCASCRSQTQELRAIDPLIKNYFQRELAIARRPRAIHRGRVLGVGGATVAAVALSLVLLIRTPQPSTVVAPVPQNSAPIASVENPAPIKSPVSPEPVRSKPLPEPTPAADRRPAASAPVTANSPDFLVTDPAGYSHSLDEYRGHVVLIGVWGHDQGESVANLERIYKANTANTNLRLLAVTNERQAKPANTTFPVFYNQGSKLFGAQTGEFVLINETGGVELRGSLVKDYEKLRRELQGK